jgi:hypothetical protein
LVELVMAVSYLIHAAQATRPTANLTVPIILHFDKGDDRLEAMGLSFAEAKAMLAAIQGRVVSAQAASFLARHRCCDLCGSMLLSKGRCQTRFRTAFSTIPLPSPRFYHCTCQPATATTFSPLTRLFTERTAPELLYLDGPLLWHDRRPAEGRPADRRHR